MKIRFTPFLILSTTLILFGIYYILNGLGGNLSPLAGMLIIVTGLICLLFYFLLRKFFKTKIKMQFITELLLIVITGFVYYLGNEEVVLHVPKNFQGYIMLVYGVDKKPEFKSKHVLNSDIDLIVPPSGIIFTSTKSPKNVVIIDSSQKQIKKSYPGHGIPTATDTLICNNKKYTLDVFVIGNLPPDWDYITDTAKRNISKQIACELLNN